MSGLLSDEQLKLQDAAFEFARRMPADMVERDRSETFDSAGWKRCAEFGVLGMPIPQEYGGIGLGLSELLVVMEGLGRGMRDQGLLFSLNADAGTTLVLVTHDEHLAARCRHQIRLDSGRRVA